MAKRVAVVLAGCGVFDGSEIHEASAVLVQLSRDGAQVRGGSGALSRDAVLVPCPGILVPVSCPVSLSRDAVQGSYPGILSRHPAPGFIVPVSYPSYLSRNPAPGSLSLDPALRSLFSAVTTKFPLLPSPSTVCRMFPSAGFHSLLPCRWPYAKTAEAMKELGCRHINSQVSQVHVDHRNLLVSTSAFMCNAPIHQIHDGVGRMVQEVLRLA
ncbi:GAL3B protein, partial [Erithacus rubecula]|nr:GAL3B protein [Erithacus rubecula]